MLLSFEALWLKSLVDGTTGGTVGLMLIWWGQHGRDFSMVLLFELSVGGLRLVRVPETLTFKISGGKIKIGVSHLESGVIIIGGKPPAHPSTLRGPATIHCFSVSCRRCCLLFCYQRGGYRDHADLTRTRPPGTHPDPAGLRSFSGWFLNDFWAWFADMLTRLFHFCTISTRFAVCPENWHMNAQKVYIGI